MGSRRDLPELKYLPRTIQAQEDDRIETDRRSSQRAEKGRVPVVRKRDVAKEHLNLLGEIVEELPGM
jgi:hypothetical protein